MTVTATPVFVQTPKITPQTFANADGTTKKTIFTAGANGSKVVAILAGSTDTAARTAQLWLTRSAVSYLLGTVVVAIGAGSDGTARTANLMPSTLMDGLPLDNDGQRYLYLESGDTLQVGFTVAVTAAKQIDINAIGADF